MGTQVPPIYANGPSLTETEKKKNQTTAIQSNSLSIKKKSIT